MTIKQAVEILERHNKWRRDNSFLPKPMTDPHTLGIAIDTIIKHFKTKEPKTKKGKVIEAVKEIHERSTSHGPSGRYSTWSSL